MGYTTDFQGSFALDKPLSKDHFNYLRQFAEVRHMKRDEKLLCGVDDPFRVAVGLPIGTEGEFYVGVLSGVESCSLAHSDRTVLDANMQASTQPSLWCDWAPNDEGTAIEWNGTEKFHNYVEWLEYIISNFIDHWGYKLNGIVEYQGEGPFDFGKIKVKNNKVTVMVGKRSYKKKV